MRLVRRLANLGYGSQKEVKSLIRSGGVTLLDGMAADEDSRADHHAILVDGQPLDPPQGMVVMLNKPVDYTCSSKDPGRVVYELLPPRFARRNPVLAPVGRLDRDSTGLLLMTDDGALSHRISAPKSHISKTYAVTLARPMDGCEADIFASGTLMLRSETTPLAPAVLVVTGTHSAHITLWEGRYHQVKRMFAAVGNHVESLHRIAVGGLELGSLGPGKWVVLDQTSLTSLFSSS